MQVLQQYVAFALRYCDRVAIAHDHDRSIAFFKFDYMIAIDQMSVMHADEVFISQELFILPQVFGDE